MDIRKTIIAFLTISALGCSPAVDFKEYYAQVQDVESEYVKSQGVNSLIYSFQQRPAGFMALTELRDKVYEPSINFDSVSRLYEDNWYVNLNLKTEAADQPVLHWNKSDDNSYYTRLQYLSGLIKEDLKMLVDGDTVHCNLHHFERSYNLKPDVNVLFVFDKQEYKSSKGELIFKDQLFNQGELIKSPIRLNLFNEKINLK